MRRRLLLPAGLLLAVGASGCGGSADPAATSRPWTVPTSAVDVPLDGVSWQTGTTLHVAGRAVDTGVAAQTYALLPDGVLLLRHDRLWFSDTRSPARSVGRGVVGRRDPMVSPDGRHVAFLDSARGPTDDAGAHFYRLDVLDTRSGKQVLVGLKGMGDLGESQPEQYEEADPSVLGIDDSAVYVQGVDGLWSYALDGSAPTRVDRAPADAIAPRTTSPDGSVRVDQGDFDFDVRDRASGRPVTFRVPGVARANKLALGGWLGPRELWGFAFHGRYAAVVGTGRMVTCTVGAPSCRPVSATLRSSTEHPVLVGGRPVE